MEKNMKITMMGHIGINTHSQLAQGKLTDRGLGVCRVSGVGVRELGLGLSGLRC